MYGDQPLMNPERVRARASGETGMLAIWILLPMIFNKLLRFCRIDAGEEGFAYAIDGLAVPWSGGPEIVLTGEFLESASGHLDSGPLK
jgi:hypothetical protein